MNQDTIKLNMENWVISETKRLSEIYNKSFLDCADLIKLTGLGRDNVRLLMDSDSFPTRRVGRRKIVSSVDFVSWQISSKNNGGS